MEETNDTWNGLAVSVIGNDHVRREQPLQDASAAFIASQNNHPVVLFPEYFQILGSCLRIAGVRRKLLCRDADQRFRRKSAPAKGESISRIKRVFFQFLPNLVRRETEAVGIKRSFRTGHIIFVDNNTRVAVANMNNFVIKAVVQTGCAQGYCYRLFWLNLLLLIIEGDVNRLDLIHSSIYRVFNCTSDTARTDRLYLH